MKTLNFILTFLTIFLALFLVVAAVHRGDATSAKWFSILSAPLLIVLCITRNYGKELRFFHGLFFKFLCFVRRQQGCR